MIRIKLTQNKYTLIDDEDYERVMNHRWYASSKTRANSYAKTSIRDSLGNSKKLYLHRLIMEVYDPKIKVDHINGNGLDNRKCNLRLCGIKQNTQNRKFYNNTSGYKGVVWDKWSNSWKAQIGVDDKNIHLGRFKNKKDAAIAYNNAALTYFKEFASLNVIKD